MQCERGVVPYVRIVVRIGKVAELRLNLCSENLLVDEGFAFTDGAADAELYICDFVVAGFDENRHNALCDVFHGHVRHDGLQRLERSHPMVVF